MRIHNPNNLPTIDYRLVKPLQGDLKDLSKTNYDKLKRVLERRGFEVPLFIWAGDSDMWLLDGHQRTRVMTAEDMNDEGSYEVPYVLIEAADRVEAKQKLLEISSQYGHITQEGFDEFMVDLPEVEVYEAVAFDALPLLGTTTDEPEVEEDEAPEVDEEAEPTSKRGEVYQLGRHRLMCGDATSKEDVDTLMGGAKANMVFTDPPYGVDYTSRVDKERRKPWGGIINDDLEGEALREFLLDSVGDLPAPKYVCCNWQSVMDFMLALGRPNAFIVWDKGSIGLGAGYRNQHEIILFYGKLDHNSESNVWSIKRDANAEYAHPTQKPVSISGRAITNSSRKGDAVLDLFGGSGSTLVACEQLDRTCYMSEIDPRYADVIRKRYHKLVTDSVDGWDIATPVIGDN